MGNSETKNSWKRESHQHVSNSVAIANIKFSTNQRFDGRQIRQSKAKLLAQSLCDKPAIIWNEINTSRLMNATRYGTAVDVPERKCLKSLFYFLGVFVFALLCVEISLFFVFGRSISTRAKNPFAQQQIMILLFHHLHHDIRKKDVSHLFHPFHPLPLSRRPVGSDDVWQWTASLYILTQFRNMLSKGPTG